MSWTFRTRDKIIVSHRRRRRRRRRRRARTNMVFFTRRVVPHCNQCVFFSKRVFEEEEELLLLLLHRCRPRQRLTTTKVCATARRTKISTAEKERFYGRTRHTHDKKSQRDGKPPSRGFRTPGFMVVKSSANICIYIYIYGNIYREERVQKKKSKYRTYNRHLSLHKRRTNALVRSSLLRRESS